MKNYEHVLAETFQTVKMDINSGALPTYIPELSGVDPEKFGVSLSLLDGRHFEKGDSQENFSIQSIAKVFSLSLAYQILGEEIWKRVDVEPSGNPFNSLVQLETDNGIPRNPFINAGAIVVCDILLDILKNPKKEILDYIRTLSGSETINFSEKVAKSELESGYRNAALCYFLKSFGNIHNAPEDVLDLYSHLCSIEMSCKTLSQSFLYLANSGKIPGSEEVILSSSKAKRINAIMQTCGFYDESGEFSFLVGLPGKSGVGGGIVAVMPHHFSIAVWSPKLNSKGNSSRGMAFLEKFTTLTEESIF